MTRTNGGTKLDRSAFAIEGAQDQNAVKGQLSII